MLFKYKVIDKDGATKEGQIEAVNTDVAINSLQGRGFVVVSVDSADKTLFVSKMSSNAWIGGILSTSDRGETWLLNDSEIFVQPLQA